MRATHQALGQRPLWLLKAALFTGALAIAGFAVSQRAHAATGLCGAGTSCGLHDTPVAAATHGARYTMALQRAGADGVALSAELSDQDFSAFSGIGVISCSVEGKTRSSTAFLVGAFDIGVTVAHTFEKGRDGAEPADCTYNSVDSLGQIRERIPVSYVRSQWAAEADAAGQPAKDLAVVRLSKPSRYAQRTMPLGRFSGAAAAVVMVGYKADLDSDTAKHKTRGTVYERRSDGLALANLAGFSHDMDSRGIAAGAPVIDEQTGVIIGIHTRLPTQRHAMITMNDWLEATLRREMQSNAQASPN